VADKQQRIRQLMLALLRFDDGDINFGLQPARQIHSISLYHNRTMEWIL